MRKIFLIICTIFLCLSIISCTPKNVEEETDVLSLDEFKESMNRKYNLNRIEISEDKQDKKMTINYYFKLGPSEADMTAVKFESLVYYKPRENNFDSLTVNIYSQDNNLVKVYTYEDEKWTEKEI